MMVMWFKQIIAYCMFMDCSLAVQNHTNTDKSNNKMKKSSESLSNREDSQELIVNREAS